jgi:hypothetical protein
MRAIFFRCKYGHFYRNRTCPYDAWSHPAYVKMEEAFGQNDRLTLQDFESQGLSRDLLNNVVIVECVGRIEIEGVIVHNYSQPGKSTWLDLAGREYGGPIVAQGKFAIDEKAVSADCVPAGEERKGERKGVRNHFPGDS